MRHEVGAEVGADVCHLSIEVLATESIYLWYLGHAHAVVRCAFPVAIADNDQQALDVARQRPGWEH